MEDSSVPGTPYEAIGVTRSKLRACSWLSFGSRVATRTSRRSRGVLGQVWTGGGR
ncbi:hypothetical protein AB0I81_15860 [Nonomuraea sp. NPDC050404]|uniref:hypothetical protein n=1 Tax=Nonomuraea sp. NPDC050404 TaxID=3155783 RepID=UPI0033C1D911